MPHPSPSNCLHIKRALTALRHSDSTWVYRPQFLASLRKPLPQSFDEILDLIVQLILLILKEAKPDDQPEPNPEPTRFPDLARFTTGTAMNNVPTSALQASAPTLLEAIQNTIDYIQNLPPDTPRKARELMRVTVHLALGDFAHDWARWNELIRNKLDSYADLDQLKSLQDYLDAWTQIKKGLDQL